MDLIILIFLAWQIGEKAKAKGLSSLKWRWRLVLTWLGFELCGGLLGIMLFGFDKNDMIGLALFALACAFGGYLLVKATLDKIPGPVNDDDIDNIGSQN